QRTPCHYVGALFQEQANDQNAAPLSQSVFSFTFLIQTIYGLSYASFPTGHYVPPVVENAVDRAVVELDFPHGFFRPLAVLVDGVAELLAFPVQDVLAAHHVRFHDFLAQLAQRLDLLGQRLDFKPLKDAHVVAVLDHQAADRGDLRGDQALDRPRGGLRVVDEVDDVVQLRLALAIRQVAGGADVAVFGDSDCEFFRHNQSTS